MNRKLKYQQLPAAFNHSLSFTVLSVSWQHECSQLL
jgi:hypothetical protein